jgi:hypothetical protein
MPYKKTPHFIGNLLASVAIPGLGFISSPGNRAANSKITGLYPTNGGNTAHTQGGFFSPVRCANAVNAGCAWITKGSNSE